MLGEIVEPEDLAAVMLDLQDFPGANNINFVSPTHVVAPIWAGGLIAAKAGLASSTGYNTGGYDVFERLLTCWMVYRYLYARYEVRQHAIGLGISKVRRYPRPTGSS